MGGTRAQPGSRVRSGLLALAAALSTAAVPGVAAAHGLPIWRAREILQEPGNPDDLILRSDDWGLMRTLDGGKTWQWICAEAYRGSSLQVQRRSMVLLPGGTLIVANLFDGLQIAPDNSLCNFEAHPTFVDEVVQDVVLAADDGSLLYVLTSTGLPDDMGLRVTVWSSTDRGLHWNAVGSAIEGSFSASSLAAAPSDPGRLYLAGKLIDDTENAQVRSSSDGGQTWQTSTVALGDSESFTARIAGVDPNDPDSVYLWKDRSQLTGVPPQPDTIWRSADGGATWSRVFEGAGDLPGFAFTPDGGRLLVSGPQDGILAADTASLAELGEQAFVQVFDGRTWGLAFSGGALLAGTDEYVSGTAPKFSLGGSLDQGKSFEPMFQICEPTLLSCGDAEQGSICGTLWPDFQKDYLLSPRCTEDPMDISSGSGSAGAPSTTNRSSGTSGVGTSGGASNNGAVASPDAGGVASPDAGGVASPDAGGVAVQSDVNKHLTASPQQGGCGCRATEGGTGSGRWAGIAGLLLAALSTRRRRRTGARPAP